MVYLYLLFEHQSSPDRLIAFRFLRYIVKVWELDIRYDLSAYSDEEIKGNIKVRIFLDLLKHIFDEDLLSHLKRILPLMKALSLDDRTSLEYIELLFRYIRPLFPSIG